MNNNKFTKEILWAISIITICILAGCFLFFKSTEKNSDITTFAYSNGTIILPDIDNQTADSDAVTTNSIANDTISESINYPSSSIKINEETDADIQNLDFSPIESTPEISPASYDCPIDFESLREINEDVYAWITIPGTIIDYPILQHETDNTYYLNYTIDGMEGYPGCIYTENINAKDFSDNNTAIYGHNMRNGTMFTDLHKFRDAEFFKENDTVYIYTPNKQLTYKIFAAYLYDDRHLMNSFDFSNQEVYSNYLSEIQAMDSEDVNIRKDIQVTDSDKIITLITCIREEPEKRVYVQAVLERWD